jgi:hypothetical protein
VVSATLSPAQRCAVAALARGETHETAALEAGVHRQTVTRWLKSPAFAEEVCRGREEHLLATRLSEVQARLTTMALTVVEQALDSGDVDAAFHWLRLAMPPGLGGAVAGRSAPERSGASGGSAAYADTAAPVRPELGSEILRSVLELAAADLCRQCVLGGLSDLLVDDSLDSGAADDSPAEPAPLAGRVDCARCNAPMAAALTGVAAAG